MITRTVWSGDGICLKEGNGNKPRQKLTNPITDVSHLRSHDEPLKRFLADYPQPKPELLLEQGHWFKYKNTWKWLGSDGEILPLENNKTLCQCFNRFHKTIFFGASHLDIDSKCCQGMCPAAAINFHLTRKVHVLIPTLHKVVKEIEADPDLDHKYAILIQVGSWDIGQHVFREAIYEVIPQLHAALQELQGSFQNRIQILVMVAPALPDRDSQGRNLVTRNNWIGAVFASQLRKHMTELNIPFLDEFSFNLPLFWYVGSWPSKMNNHHYAEWIAGKNRSFCRGHVGMGFIHLMLSKLCPGLDMY
jgi:hypothetical protein